MARGRTHRSYYREAKAREKGKLQAQVEHENKLWSNKKHQKQWFIKQLEKHMEKIPKAATIIGLTILIKGLIDKSEEIRAHIMNIGFTPPPISPIPELQIPYQTFRAWWEAQRRRPEDKSFEGMFPDWADWLIAFALAYVITEHGGQIILGLIDRASSITGVIKFFVGMPI